MDLVVLGELNAQSLNSHYFCLKHPRGVCIAIVLMTRALINASVTLINM